MPVATRIVRKEYWKYITPDGVSYLLDVGKDRVVLTDESTGMPPIDYISQRGIHQHGETLVDYYLLPRVVQLIIRHDYCSRDEYWAGRDALLDALRPNRGVPITLGILQKLRSDGSKRNLRVVILEGPKFEQRKLDAWDEWAFTETLRFLAHNPVWYDPTQHSCIITPGLDTSTCQLVFPITFPITFGVCSYTSGVGCIGGINYVGTWEEYPTICITGPWQNFSIYNDTTGESIGLAYDIPAGRSVGIYLDYGNKHVLLDDGTDLIGYVSRPTDLVTFHLKAKTLNLIRVEGQGMDACSNVTITYYDRYIGI